MISELVIRQTHLCVNVLVFCFCRNQDDQRLQLGNGVSTLLDDLKQANQMGSYAAFMNSLRNVGQL